MYSVIQILTFFWLIRIFQQILFWTYLWQLKEYHIGRFRDHFRTHKGKKLIFGFLPTFKLILLILLLAIYYFLSFKGLFSLIFFILLLFYTIESLAFLFKLSRGKFKRPIFTAKAIFLTLASFGFVILSVFLLFKYVIGDFWFVFYILLFDFLTPLAISLLVLFFQPFFIFLRNRVLKKAKGKILKFKNLTVVGITGSYGKTSTKEFLTTILSQKFNVLSTEKNQNSEIGIAKCILEKLNDKHQVFVIEMGAYKKGGISLLCEIIKPKIGVVTGVNEQHLATFGSMENLLSAEGGVELAESLPRNGLIVVNGDNRYCLNLYRKVNVRKKVYTLKRNKIDSDIFAEEPVIERDSISFIAITKEGEMGHFDVSILGSHNIPNMLAVITVAKELGMSLEEIALAAKNIKQEQAGIILKKGVQGINIIDSSYSSNPDGVMADLDYLNIFPNKKVVIMPCLIELSKKSSEIHQQIGKKIAEVCDMAIITTKDKFEDLKIGAVINGMPKDKIIFSEKPKEIFHLITTFCKEGDAILLEGRVPSELIKMLVK